ncbi:MAG: SDR family oxidoreductase [Trueperaceae bacterium]|nr:SDR family oxidoreductase [Trueperaceae bacterium]
MSNDATNGAKVALVTGAAQGIGWGVTRRLLQEGYRVVGADLDAEALQEAARSAATIGDSDWQPCDVGDEAAVTGLVEAALTRYGRLDVLVNNAGISANRPVTELSLEDWNRVLRTNLTGMFLCAKHAAPALREQRGSIVNIASTRALMSEADTEAYSASKGGVVALTHALAVSLGPEVRVNAISPGWIDVRPYQKASERDTSPYAEHHHAQHPAGRIGTPDDVAEALVYLVAQGFVTGQNLIVDGGMTRNMIYE